jgi:hypothetical protein
MKTMKTKTKSKQPTPLSLAHAHAGLRPREGRKGTAAVKWAVDRLNKGRQYWIATTRPDKRPHVMVVWALRMNGVLYFSTGKTSRKARNLAKSTAPCVPGERAEAVIIDGEVKTERDVERVRTFIRLYEKKYKRSLGKWGED